MEIPTSRLGGVGIKRIGLSAAAAAEEKNAGRQAREERTARLGNGLKADVIDLEVLGGIVPDRIEAHRGERSAVQGRSAGEIDIENLPIVRFCGEGEIVGITCEGAHAHDRFGLKRSHAQVLGAVVEEEDGAIAIVRCAGRSGVLRIATQLAEADRDIRPTFARSKGNRAATAEDLGIDIDIARSQDARAASEGGRLSEAGHDGIGGRSRRGCPALGISGVFKFKGHQDGGGRLDEKNCGGGSSERDQIDFHGYDLVFASAKFRTSAGSVRHLVAGYESILMERMKIFRFAKRLFDLHSEFFGDLMAFARIVDLDPAPESPVYGRFQELMVHLPEWRQSLFAFLALPGWAPSAAGLTVSTSAPKVRQTQRDG